MSFRDLSEGQQHNLAIKAAQYCGIGDLESKFWFDGRHKAAQAAIRDLLGPVQGVWPQFSVLISGSVATGKTGLLSAMLKWVFIDWAINFTVDPAYLPAFFARDVFFVTEYELHQALQAEISMDSNRFTELKQCKLLLIDDLGASHQTDYRLAKIEELIHFRYSNRLTTWITSNYTSTEIKTWSGWERIVSRFSDKTVYRYFELSGADRRKEKK